MTGDQREEIAAHTPGPWRVFQAPNGKIIGIGELTGEGVADCGFGVWRGGSAEALANARLIAAAPELLEAVKILLPILEAVRYTTGLGKTQIARIEKAKATIAKATGE